MTILNKDGMTVNTETGHVTIHPPQPPGLYKLTKDIENTVMSDGRMKYDWTRRKTFPAGLVFEVRQLKMSEGYSYPTLQLARGKGKSPGQAKSGHIAYSQDEHKALWDLLTPHLEPCFSKPSMKERAKMVVAKLSHEADEAMAEGEGLDAILENQAETLQEAIELIENIIINGNISPSFIETWGEE